MKLTPPKLPPIPLSPKHQRSVEKSKAINQKVESFVNSNFKDSPVSSEGKMAVSSASLSNTKAFFESEIKLVMKMVEQSSKLYKQKENQNAELQKKLKDCESKIAQLEKAAIEYTANKIQQQTSKMQEVDERKTRKKPLIEEKDSSKGLNRTTSEFVLDKVSVNHEIQWKQMYENLKRQTNKKIRKFEAMTKDLKSQIHRQKQANIRINEEKAKCAAAAAKATSDYGRLEKEYKTLASQYNLLEKRYNELENKHGLTTAEYEIKLTNLKSLITGINQKISPKKSSEKQAEGYYSINKPLNRNESQQSLESSSSSKYLTPSHAETNLKEENEYLRTELIRVLDQKAALQMRHHQYKKFAAKYDNLVKIIQQQQFLPSENQNNQSLANTNKPKDETTNKAKDDSKTEKSFKKKRQYSVLLVQSTQIKQKELLEEQKIINLFIEISSYVQPDKKYESKNHDTRLTQIEILEKVLAKLKDNLDQLIKLRRSLKQSEDEKKELENEKVILQEKYRRDSASLKKYLEDSNVNFTTPKSEDSTDKAFKNINLMKVQQEKQEQRSHECEGFSKSMLSHYSQSEVDHQNEIRLMKEKIFSLEQTIEKLKKQNSKDLSEVKSNEELKENRYSPARSYPSEFDRFELFKQKMNEFYQNTMKQLNNWEQRAIKTLEKSNSAKALSKIQEIQNQNPSQIEIPVIVQRNLMKMSQEFESINNSSFDQSTIMKNEEYGKMLFASQKLSKSFIKSQSQDPSETFEDIINKKLEDFNQFSSNWIEKLKDKDTDKKEPTQKIIEMEELKFRQKSEKSQSEIPKLTNSKGSKTERSATESDRSFKLDLQEIDAKSDWMPDEEIRAQRNLLIREEVSYEVPKSKVPRSMQGNSSSKRSYMSFEL